MDALRAGTTNSTSGCETADLGKVEKDELRAIAQRRERQFGDNSKAPNPSEGLCGLALSGGGIRAAATCLGFLDALTKRKLLRLVDYVSTVSGGGYAGAFLSSSALADSQTVEASDDEALATADGSQQVVGATNYAKGAKSNPLPDIGVENERLEARTLRFVYGGFYLRKTWMFFNRYVIGLILVWTVLISGLLAMAAAGALLFRSLDYPVVRTALSALDFGGDVWLALFPSFVLLLVWLIAWGISYFKFNARATGSTARWLFYGLVIVTVTAFAALVGAGDIAASATFSGSLAPGNTLGKTIFAIAMSGLAASLLPYFAPKSLLQSGVAPRNARDKYAFWFATRAVVYGVPFVAIAFLTRENISRWNERRDERLSRTDVTDLSQSNPIWRELIDEKGPSTKEFGLIWADSPARSKAREVYEQLSATRNAVGPARTDFNEWNRLQRAKDKSQDVLESSVPTYPTADSVSPSRDHVVAARPIGEAATSFFDRWWHFATYLVHRVSLDGESARENQFYADWDSQFRQLQLHDRLMHQVNERLKDPGFYQGFWPYDEWPAPQVNPSEKRANEQWKFARLAKIGLLPLSLPAGPIHWLLEAVADPGPTSPVPSNSPDNSRDLSQEFRLAFVRTDKSGKRKNGELPETDIKKECDRWCENLSHLTAEAKKIEKHYTTEPRIRDAGYTDTDELHEAYEANRERDIIGINRRLMAAYFGDRINDKSIVYSANVLHEDQWTRLRWLLWSLGIFIVSGLVMDLNATSLHGFYSTRVAEQWIEPSPSYGRNIPLAQLRTTDVGKPYQLINGTVQLFRRGDDEKPLRNEAFLFSQLYCGSDTLRYVRTAEYMDGKYDLADAIAVSGAAITPALSPNPLVLVLLWLANLRMGQWIENPSNCPPKGSRTSVASGRWPVTPLRVLVNLLRSPPQRQMCFVSDGGHYENTGIESLLLRKCKIIFALDATQDANYAFADFTRLVRRMRMKHGIKIMPWNEPGELRLDVLTPAGACPPESQNRKAAPATDAKLMKSPKQVSDSLQARTSSQHFTMMRVRYRAGHPEQDGCLIYAKSTLTGDEPFDLVEFAKSNVCFPHDETADQFFEADRFESYRQLGAHIGKVVCQHLESRIEPAGSAGDPTLLIDWTHAAVKPDDAASSSTLESADLKADDEIGRELRVIADLLNGKNEKGAVVEMEAVLEKRPISIATLRGILELAHRLPLFSRIAPLHGQFSKHPDIFVPLLRDIVTDDAEKSIIRVDAIHHLDAVFELVGDHCGTSIVACLVEALEPASPTSVVKAALDALQHMAPDHSLAREKAQGLVESDSRSAVVRYAKRFLEPAASGT